MKKTLNQLLEIDAVMAKLYAKTPELKDTKFGYAYSRFTKKNMEPIQKKFNEKLADLAVEHALEDKDTKELLIDAKGNYKYSREGRMAYLKAVRAYTDKGYAEEHEVEPYIATYAPTLTEEEFETLEGILVESPKKAKKE